MANKNMWQLGSVFFVGLSAGVLWSPIDWPSRDEGNTVLASHTEEDRIVEKMKDIGGEETERFVEQFNKMTKRIKDDPFDAVASRDGRFVIRLSENGEAIASDLAYPDVGGGTDLVRTYSFSHDGRVFNCDFGRNHDDSELKYIFIRLTNSDGREMSYLDTDSDGLWDVFKDGSGEEPTIYDRDGKSWITRASK